MAQSDGVLTFYREALGQEAFEVTTVKLADALDLMRGHIMELAYRNPLDMRRFVRATEALAKGVDKEKLSREQRIEESARRLAEFQSRFGEEWCPYRHEAPEGAGERVELLEGWVPEGC